jgi:polar amino acid transport system substrate-binding protein
VNFIDLLVYFAGCEPVQVTTTALPDNGRYTQDNFVVTLTFADGSVGTVTYAASGNKAFGKEMLELFGGGLAARLDDYRELTIRRGKERVRKKAWLRQDKGHKAEWVAWRDYLLGQGEHPMPFADVLLSTKATLAAYKSLREARPVAVSEIQHTKPKESE